jgi:hypothetical protein
MKKRCAIFSLLVVSLLCVRQAEASITIQPGTYEVPALVRNTLKGPEAVFNVHLRSECRVTLKGAHARTLARRMKNMAGLVVQFKVTKSIESPGGEAELLKSSELGKARIPVRVGNDLKSID